MKKYDHKTTHRDIDVVQMQKMLGQSSGSSRDMTVDKIYSQWGNQQKQHQNSMKSINQFSNVNFDAPIHYKEKQGHRNSQVPSAANTYYKDSSTQRTTFKRPSTASYTNNPFNSKMNTYEASLQKMLTNTSGTSRSASRQNLGKMKTIQQDEFNS